MSINEREMVTLFADFRGFSHMFDVLPAHKVYKFTNRYFQTASDIIRKYKGILDIDQIQMLLSLQFVLHSK